MKLQDSTSEFEIEWVDEKLHQDACRLLRRSGRRAVSFVDQVSFIIMRARGLETALAFDSHFAQEGFKLYGA